jgi:hypothetical protein
MRDVYFAHIPKTAGCSIDQICRPNGIKVIGHDTRTKEYSTLDRRIEDSKKWFSFLLDEPFVFTIVRNPWDRVISSFFYLNQGGCNNYDVQDKQKYLENFNGDFKRFVRSLEHSREVLEQIHFRPQYQWICDSNGEIIVDYIGKFENIQRDIFNLTSKVGIQMPELPHLNKSKHLHYETYYDNETREIIGEVYKKDIDFFNYEF